MSGLWYPKQSPVQGITGLWGGNGSALVGGAAPGLDSYPTYVLPFSTTGTTSDGFSANGKAKALDGQRGWAISDATYWSSGNGYSQSSTNGSSMGYSSNSVTWTLPDATELQWVYLVCIGGGGGGNGYGAGSGGGGGGWAFCKLDLAELGATSLSFNTGKGNPTGSNTTRGGTSSITVSGGPRNGQTIMYAQGGSNSSTGHGNSNSTGGGASVSSWSDQIYFAASSTGNSGGRHNAATPNGGGTGGGGGAYQPGSQGSRPWAGGGSGGDGSGGGEGGTNTLGWINTSANDDSHIAGSPNMATENIINDLADVTTWFSDANDTVGSTEYNFSGKDGRTSSSPGTMAAGCFGSGGGGSGSGSGFYGGAGACIVWWYNA